MNDRLKSWVHYVSANPLNDDQLLLANDVAALLEQLEEARAVIEYYSDVGSGTHNGFYVYALATKARTFLEKWGCK